MLQRELPASVGDTAGDDQGNGELVVDGQELGLRIAADRATQALHRRDDLRHDARMQLPDAPVDPRRPWGDTTIVATRCAAPACCTTALRRPAGVERQRYMKRRPSAGAPRPGERLDHPGDAGAAHRSTRRCGRRCSATTVTGRARRSTKAGRWQQRLLEAAPGSAPADRACALWGVRQPAGRGWPRLPRLRRRAPARGVRQPAAIRREVLESIILDALRSRLMQPNIVAEFAEAWQQEVNRQRAGADAGRERLARELAQVERKLAGLVEAIAGGLRAPSLQQTLDDLEQRRAPSAGNGAGAPAAPAPEAWPRSGAARSPSWGRRCTIRTAAPRRSKSYAV